MQPAGQFISPKENEIPLLLTTNKLPDPSLYGSARTCDLTFPLNPGLQFSNTKWSIGLKALTIPTRINNIDPSFKIFVLDGSSIIEIMLGEGMYYDLNVLTSYLNNELANTPYGAYIKFGVAGKIVTCNVTTPAQVQTFEVTFTPNLSKLLGFEYHTVCRGSPTTGRLYKATMLPDPLADFKLINVKCANAEPLSTNQMRGEKQVHPETCINTVQVVSNFGIDDNNIIVPTESTPCSLFTVTIPTEGVIFYPLASQTLYSLKFKLSSLSDQLLKVDPSLPVVVSVILRKSDYSFI